MTQQEFTERVKVEVSPEEYEAINTVYNNSSLDKDEFCAIWRKMNRTRVQAAAKMREERMTRQQNAATLYSAQMKLQRAIAKKWNADWTAAKLNKKELEALAKVGIETVWFSHFDYKTHNKPASNVAYAIKQFFNTAA